MTADEIIDVAKQVIELESERRSINDDFEYMKEKLGKFIESRIDLIDISFNDGDGNDWLYNNTVSQDLKSYIIQDYKKLLNKKKEELDAIDKRINDLKLKLEPSE
jgi:predicted nucleotide-binding protein (sugar kinase/HSP70/actin superfamily)